ncbi:MAG: FlgO family outer membrane protein [Pseudomonadota bacterium]
MKTNKIILVAVVLLLAACAGMGKKEEIGMDNLFFIEGTVQDVSGNEVGLLLKIPEIKKTPGSPVSDIAQQVVQKSLLVEGVTTEINGQTATVKEIRGNAARITFKKPVSIVSGTVLKLKVPKKTIAVVDFEVIKGNVKEAGRVTLEGLTSALVDSGQFIVLERSKLKAIMNELELSLSGMARETPDKFAGKLMIADLILTGTLADMQNEWEINLRLLNTRSGQAIAAISMKTRLFKPTELRDSGPWNEDFEAARLDPSWMAGYRKIGKGNASFDVLKDNSTGADGSKNSMRIDFRFGNQQDIFAGASNKKKRDISLYNGIEFYARATGNIFAQFNMDSSSPDNPNQMDRWVGVYEVSQEWQKIRIPFESMTVGRGWIKRGAAKWGAIPGDQAMRLNRIESIVLSIGSGNNRETEGSMWIDKIGFYSD